MNAIHPDILDTIGNTPVVRLSDMSPANATIYAKLEAFNPGGSVKDRLAAAIIEEAERTGALKPGQTVIEATSGNTGIGLAVVCAKKGYPLVIVMPENASIERRKLMRFYGAKVVLTPAAEKGSGMMAKAMELAEAHGWFLCRQFETAVNADIHSKTTAREILQAFDGRRLDYFVTGFGTGGTMAGVARVLKKERPQTRIIVCEPDNSAMLGSGEKQGFDASGMPTQSHSKFRPHPMQGWSPDFIPKIVGRAMDEGLVDEIRPVSGQAALETSRALARKEGILVGISSGATLAAAIDVASSAGEGETVLCMLPDTGERYLSTVLFDEIKEGMSPDEVAISRSTPNYRFDRQSSGTKPSSDFEDDVQTDPAIQAFVEGAINDPGNPISVFALSWCEFCWSVRNLLQDAGVPYRAIEIDSPAFQRDGRDGEMRKVLRKITGSPTIPQIFIGGRHVGGCTDLIEGWRDGSIKAELNRLEVQCRPEACNDPERFLPKWVLAQN